MITKRRFWKPLLTSLVVTGATLSASFLGIAQKAEAQSASAFLTSGLGRWLEINHQLSSCYIYDFKPSGFPGVLGVVREQYGINPVSRQCRFSFGPIGGIRSGNIARVNGNVVTIQYVTSPNSGEQIQLLQPGQVNGIRAIAIARGRTTSIWYQSPR